jgi:hypothetical protein
LPSIFDIGEINGVMGPYKTVSNRAVFQRDPVRNKNVQGGGRQRN